MPEKELARRLRAIYDAMSARQEVVIAFCLFAVVYEQELRGYKNKARLALCRAAGLPDSYAGEIYKGQKLAPYAELKPEMRDWLRSLGHDAEHDDELSGKPEADIKIPPKTDGSGGKGGAGGSVFPALYRFRYVLKPALPLPIYLKARPARK